MSAKKFLTLLRKPLAVVLAAAAVVSGVWLASLSPQVQSPDSGRMTGMIGPKVKRIVRNIPTPNIPVMA